MDTHNPIISLSEEEKDIPILINGTIYYASSFWHLKNAMNYIDCLNATNDAKKAIALIVYEEIG